MGYLTYGLTFQALTEGNRVRLSFFRKGVSQEWSPSQWLQAVIGELGEYANLRKKVERGDFPFETVKEKLASELADAVIYLDLLASNLGINLGEAVMKTWNKKSDDEKIPMCLDSEDWHFTRELTAEEKVLYNNVRK